MYICRYVRTYIHTYVRKILVSFVLYVCNIAYSNTGGCVAAKTVWVESCVGRGGSR